MRDVEEIVTEVLGSIEPSLVDAPLMRALISNAIFNAYETGRRETLSEIQGIAAASHQLYDNMFDTVIKPLDLPTVIARYKTLHDLNMATRIAKRDETLKKVQLNLLSYIEARLLDRCTFPPQHVLDNIEELVEDLRKRVDGSLPPPGFENMPVIRATMQRAKLEVLEKIDSCLVCRAIDSETRVLDALEHLVDGLKREAVGLGEPAAVIGSSEPSQQG